MEIITALKPEEMEIQAGLTDENINYVQDTEIYNLLFELDELKFDMFILENYPKTFKEYIELDDSMFLEKARIRNRYRQDYDSSRPKFMAFDNHIYSYTFLGEMNVGHVIEIIRYDSHDVVELLNDFSSQRNSKKSRWFN